RVSGETSSNRMVRPLRPPSVPVCCTPPRSRARCAAGEGSDLTSRGSNLTPGVVKLTPCHAPQQRSETARPVHEDAHSVSCWRVVAPPNIDDDFSRRAVCDSIKASGGHALLRSGCRTGTRHPLGGLAPESRRAALHERATTQ